MTLSTQGYRGTRDFYPQDVRLRKYIFETVHCTMMSFGYEEYDGPFLEPLDLYLSKSSEEIVTEQLYSFTDKGERKVAIRPEMTPTLARMVASKQRELPKPIRWYSIPTCMRFERPQRGRLREFAQLNVDVFGGNALDEDIEVILTAAALMKSLGASNAMYEIHINHRGVMNDLLYKTLGISADLKSNLLRILDKKDKMSDADFKDQCMAVGLTHSQTETVFAFMSGDLDLVSNLLANEDSCQQLHQRLRVLTEVLGPEVIKFKPSVMRGFEYYTGMVFEIFDTHPDNRRALFGGGRYDNLVASFTDDSLSGIGYGVSDVSLINFLEVHKLTPELKKKVDICVVRFQDADRLDTIALAQTLRQVGLVVENCLTSAKFGKQIQAAQRNGAKAICFRGAEEIAAGTVCVKWLETGVQEHFSNDENGARGILNSLRLK